MNQLRSIIFVSIALGMTVGCETTVPPVDVGGEDAGESAGESMSGEEMAGEGAGEMSAGEGAGEMSSGEMSAGEVQAGTEVMGGEMVDAGENGPPTFDPAGPLPTPQRTSYDPPADIAEPSTATVDPNCGGHFVSEVRGWVVDEVGEPMSGAKVQLCVRDHNTGVLSCLRPQDTAEGGYFVVSVPESARCMGEAAFRSIVPNVAFAPMYCQADFSNEGEDGVLRVTEPLVLYQTRPAISSDEPDGSGDPKSVSFLGELTISFDPDKLYGPTFDELGARPIPMDGPGLCFIDPSQDPQIDGLFAFAPEGDLDGVNATLRFPNTAGYAAGSNVAIYVLGNLSCSIIGAEEPLEEATWSQQALGVVDESGMWVEANAEQGLPCLSWFGYGLLP